MLNKNTYIPLYQQIIDYMHEKIESGEYKPGDMLPSEASLCDEFGVSRITVRNAIQYLTDEGYIVKRHGKGSFINDKLSKPASRFIRFTELCKEQGVATYNQTVSVEEIPATHELIRKLDLTYGESVILMTQLRYANYKPAILLRGYFPADTFGFLLQEDPAKQELAKLILAHTGIDIDTRCGYRDVMSVSAAKKEDAELLKIKTGSPVYMLTETVSQMSGKPFFMLKEMLSGSMFDFELTETGAMPVIKAD